MNRDERRHPYTVKMLPTLSGAFSRDRHYLAPGFERTLCDRRISDYRRSRVTWVNCARCSFRANEERNANRD
jgi:hypothetical protein